LPSWRCRSLAPSHDQETSMKQTFLGILLSVLFAGPLPAQWFQGNTHAHTLNSDGDSTPDDVVRWYREHGYDFVFVTDHGMVTDVAPLNALNFRRP